MDQQFLFALSAKGAPLAITEWTTDFLVYATYENILRLIYSPKEFIHGPLPAAYADKILIGTLYTDLVLMPRAISLNAFEMVLVDVLILLVAEDGNIQVILNQETGKPMRIEEYRRLKGNPVHTFTSAPLKSEIWDSRPLTRMLITAWFPEDMDRI